MLHNSTLFAFLLFLNSIILLQVGKANVIPTSISPPTEAPRMNTHSKRWLWEGTRGNYDLILNVRQLLPPDQIKADRLLWVFHSIGCAVDAILDSLKEYTTYRTETDWQERHAKLFHTKADLVGLEVILLDYYPKAQFEDVYTIRLLITFFESLKEDLLIYRKQDIANPEERVNRKPRFTVKLNNTTPDDGQSADVYFNEISFYPKFFQGEDQWDGMWPMQVIDMESKPGHFVRIDPKRNHGKTKTVLLLLFQTTKVKRQLRQTRLEYSQMIKLMADMYNHWIRWHLEPKTQQEIEYPKSKFPGERAEKALRELRPDLQRQGLWGPINRSPRQRAT